MIPERYTYKEFAANGLGITHLALLISVGVVSVYSDWVVSFAWFAVAIISVIAFLKGNTYLVWYCIAASPVLEVWARMVKAPFLPYEVGKYYLILAILLLWANHIRISAGKPLHKAGFILIAVILPGLVVNLVSFNADQWVFNALGVLELAILLVFASMERWNVERSCRTLQYGLMPIVPVLIYLSLSASNFNKMTFGLVANAAASGGFGSNQVSTVIGSSIVLLLLLQVLKRPLFSFWLFNYALLALLIFRGLLTFSRGGMIVAGIAVFVALSPNIFTSLRSFIRYTAVFVAVAAMSAFIFIKVNAITGNNLLLRYQGENFSTLRGHYEKNLNSITSGRYDIVLSDYLMFKEHFLFGVGPGISKTLRAKYGYQNIAAHTEFSRLLSEHGVGGVFAVLVLLLFPIWWLKRQRLLKWRGIAGALFTLAILTTFHAAMRTNITIVSYVLAAIPVFYYTRSYKVEAPNEDIIHRQ